MADMLALWGDTRSARVSRIDFGSVPARSSSDVRLRVRNLSSQYTARGVVISVEDVTAWASTQLLLSLDGVNFTATVMVGDLPATGTSPVFTLRRATPSDEPTGAKECNIRVHATAWVPADTLN